MGLLGEVQAAQAAKRRGSKRCGIWEVKEALSKADADDLEVAMGDHAIMATTLAEFLVAKGFDRVSDQIVRHHRKGKCGCPR